MTFYFFEKQKCIFVYFNWIEVSFSISNFRRNITVLKGIFVALHSRYLDSKEKPKKTKYKRDNQRKREQETIESEKRSFKKEREK